jgi:hypothetical protein
MGVFSLSLCLGGTGFAATSSSDLPDRLFYTPAQRAQLEAARARNVTEVRANAPRDAQMPVYFDGVVIRSDGKTTRWVDGKAQAGNSGIAHMKPGQIRANGKLYEPYQVQRPQPDTDNEKEPTP